MALCGGTAQSRTPTDDEVTLLVGMREQVEEKLGKKFEVFEAVQVATQVVAGTNYFAKMRTGNAEFVHIRVYKPLPHTKQPAELHAVQADKSEAEPVGYFEK